VKLLYWISYVPSVALIIIASILLGLHLAVDAVCQAYYAAVITPLAVASAKRTALKTPATGQEKKK
jgi:hypothetical protein